MVIDVRLVPEGHSDIEQKTRLSTFEADLPPFAEPVDCVGTVDRMVDTVVVSLRFSGEFDVECARCLEVYRQPVSGELRVIVKEEQGRHGASLDDDSGVDFYFDVNHELVDISSAIFDEIMIALPLKPLCSEDCEGIRFDGGVGGDTGVVDEKPVDPRWAGLMKLKSGQ